MKKEVKKDKKFKGKPKDGDGGDHSSDDWSEHDSEDEEPLYLE